MTILNNGAPLRVLRLGRAFSLTKALSTGIERESFVSLEKYP